MFLLNNGVTDVMSTACFPTIPNQTHMRKSPNQEIVNDSYAIDGPFHCSMQLATCSDIFLLVSILFKGMSC